MSDVEYTNFLQDMDFKAASFTEISQSLIKNGIKEMYHALVNEADIGTLFKIPDLKIFWLCRCHHVADNESTSHEHHHALVQYENGQKHYNFKRRL